MRQMQGCMPGTGHRPKLENQDGKEYIGKDPFSHAESTADGRKGLSIRKNAPQIPLICGAFLLPVTGAGDVFHWE